MPIFEVGDMWSAYNHHESVFVFTANSTLKSNGELVMGAGIARAVRDRLPGIARAFGVLVGSQRFPDEYGFLILDYKGKRIGALQVKTRFDEKASLALIRSSIEKLARWAGENLDTEINMNFPGIGCGGLAEDLVRPILLDLPKNVRIWKLNPT